jgi:hypothetical protein
MALTDSRKVDENFQRVDAPESIDGRRGSDEIEHGMDDDG